MKQNRILNHQTIFSEIALTLTFIIVSGCSSTPLVRQQVPISNPFLTSEGSSETSTGYTIKTQRGDQIAEVNIPGIDQDHAEVVLPLSPSYTKEEGEEGNDNHYSERKKTKADIEIAANLPKPSITEDDPTRKSIEETLGVESSIDSDSDHDASYLARLDKIKTLYKKGRLEASLIEVEDTLVFYPTDSKLYQMRGTLLSKMGKQDLAIQSWQQAMHFNPENKALKRFIEKKQKIRTLASEGSSHE